jgi:hypothetical protein
MGTSMGKSNELKMLRLFFSIATFDDWRAGGYLITYVGTCTYT